MNKLIPCAAFVLMLLIPIMGLAQDFNVGMAAHKAGDYAAALREWGPLAEQGDVDGQYNLALMYLKGEGVPQASVEAAKWFQMAARQGDTDAQHNLGVMFAKGDGVPQNYVFAHMWFNIAAATGSADAASYRDKVAAIMTLADLSEAQRRASACMASNYQNCD